jgi:hypothetical protein
MVEAKGIFKERRPLCSITFGGKTANSTMEWLAGGLHDFRD